MEEKLLLELKCRRHLMVMRCERMQQVCNMTYVSFGLVAPGTLQLEDTVTTQSNRFFKEQRYPEALRKGAIQFFMKEYDKPMETYQEGLKHDPKNQSVTAWDHIFSDQIFSDNIFSDCKSSVFCLKTTVVVFY
ncbi:hypothetical protein Bca101_011313 [Brassica carinata]